MGSLACVAHFADEASFLAAKAAGCSTGFTWSLRGWVWYFIEDEDILPKSKYGTQKSCIHDEDVAQEIQLHLQSLQKKYFPAMDVVHFLDQPEVKARLKFKKTPTKCTCHKWLHAMEYHFGKASKGMYIDGHEHEDPKMMKWSAHGDIILSDLCHIGEKKVVLITHNESTFYANDWCPKQWIHSSEKPAPVQKGEGVSIIVSDFYSPDLGWLISKDSTQEACILFKAGKNQDGYFDCTDLCKQVSTTIDLFEDNFPDKSAVAAFGFDNAPGHQKHPEDALSARNMPKKTQHWWGKSGKCKMRKGMLPDGTPQDFYYPDNHPKHPGLFKGMAKILEEWGLINESKL
ncbi:hypothetical protein M422DRAFT_180562 [Sphaerobolus stellatus SS14]|uniref:Uncharacterized protein n=1 Tax=Sphaerobolus stellatus (strain SS14) TaxID=990650 RepID=A0A0C9VD84_SPHS4|nr:hypothetical protein M422DRAFT_180562 [Sphaerobolus stellatus SS14]